MLRLFWDSVRFPLIWIGFVLTLFYFWPLVGLPTQDTALPAIRFYVQTYGLPVVFVSALFESTLIVGWYFPGSIVIFLSVALAPTPLYALGAGLAAATGLYTGYTLDYLLGRHGWYRLLLKFGIREQLAEAEQKLSRHGVKAIFACYWMPGLAGLVATAAGVLQYSTKKFLVWSAVATLLWCTFWGVLVYNVGENALALVLTPGFIVTVIALWGLGRFVAAFYHHYSSLENNR